MPSRRHALAGLVSFPFALTCARAQPGYPSRPARIIVGYTAGGAVTPGPVSLFAKLLQDEAARYARLIQDAQIKPD